MSKSEKNLINYNLVKRAASSSCWVCGKDTEWVELNFEVYMCPGDCVNKAWAKYWAAIRLAKKNTHEH